MRLRKDISILRYYRGATITRGDKVYAVPEDIALSLDGLQNAKPLSEENRKTLERHPELVRFGILEGSESNGAAQRAAQANR